MPQLTESLSISLTIESLILSRSLKVKAGTEDALKFSEPLLHDFVTLADDDERAREQHSPAKHEKGDDERDHGGLLR